MSGILTESANEHVRAAQRYAAELLDRLGPAIDRDHELTIIAVAYLEGQCQQLRWARDTVRGDG